MRGLFFTGTDTGVGKTFVVSAVARALRLAGRPVRVSKPVATGATLRGGDWVGDDTIILAAALGESGRDQWKVITPFSFPAEAAPPVAARLAGVGIRLSDLIGGVQAVYRRDGLLLVEGVGGLLCPLTETQTVADLALSLAFPLVVVTRRSLGTLNHTLLTVEAALNRGLRVAGVVVSETAPPAGIAVDTNVEELRSRLPVPILAVVPHTEDRERAALAVASVDWEALASDNDPEMTS